jgi:hypothetical protein
MKHLRQLCAAAVLTLMLAFSAFAGNIECGAVPPPPDPPASVTGDIHCGVTATDRTSSDEAAFVDPATDFTLNILRSVLSLF